MSGFKKTFFCLCTLVIIAAGFFMPDLASRGLDWRLYNSVEQMENKKVSLVLLNSEEGIKSACTFFNLINSNISVVEISETSKVCNLTYDKVKSISLKIWESLDILDDSLDENYNAFKAVPNLFISIGDEAVEQSTVYWRCSWLDKNNIQQVMWIDDISGKMVGLIMNEDEAAVHTQSEQKLDVFDEEIPEEIEALGEYCKENYHADDVICRKDSDSHYIIEVIINKNGYGLTNDFISVYFEKDKYLLFNMR